MTKQKAKDTFFSKNHSLNCRGKLINLSTPKVMGILNLTADSFYDGGQYMDPGKALAQVREMLTNGADMIDIGAASSRPGAALSTAEEELKILSPSVSLIRKEFPDAILSIDTYHAEVAKEMILNHETDMINDISAGNMDSNMIPVISNLNVPYIIMHMKGIPGDMQENPQYKNVTDEIIQFFSERVHMLSKRGLSDILIDPGFGFGKSLEHNFELLSKTEAFQLFELPIVVGVSRKSMIYNLLDSNSKEALNGTTAAHMLLLQKGANILRVHDVKEAKEAISIYLETSKY